MTTHDLSTKITKPAYGRKPSTPREPCRDSKEVARMFGYKGGASLNAALQQGYFPPPDLISGITVKKLYWKLSTLEKERRRRDGQP